ncbi:TIGR01777 family oxidoreductase [Williamsia phyllosphaerae]|uniref:Nucleoside-diphosphate sugar epimerase n=1 Tax=Williamsia phyllosphaerae TaxID=885042 RepID=A0ABQ1V875_9NOCA|nr:TIGR01777 family oxidoreductase [Williamsia phyllosphaerae]GGF43721.1 nucleoside-diphosphate sugar epimerase [Williamsia phyllosphaerae]
MSITRSSVVDDSIDEVFAWHKRPGAFHRLSPGFAPMSLRSEATSIEDGKAILVLPGGLTWTASHQPDGFRPPNQFVDKLTSFPLRYVTPWTHTHNFDAVDADHTRVTDNVDTRVPGFALSSMFDFRHRQLADDIITQKWARSLQPTPLTIGMTGVSGTIGTALAALATTGGHRVVSLVRRAPVGDDERRWDPDNPAADLLDGLDVVIHLAGSSIAGRFTDAHVSRVRHSRVEPSHALARVAAAAAADGRGPRVFVGASAIGFYGADRGDEELTETSTPGDGVIADIVRDWESAYAPAAEAGLRVVTVRTGVVQASAGGMLKVLKPVFGAGLGGPIGDGTQWLSWIGLEDVCDVFYRAALDERLSGPVNAVSPEPVRNSEFTDTMGTVLHRPTVLRVPEFAPKLVLTESGAGSLALASQRVLPEALAGIGHDFRMPALADTLRHQCGR